MRKRQKKLKLPAEYYTVHEQPFNRKEINRLLGKYYFYTATTFKEAVNYLLHNNYLQEPAEEMLGEVIASALERYDKNLLQFFSHKGLVGYLLRGCWNNYKYLNRERKSTKALPDFLDEDWWLEGGQKIATDLEPEFHLGTKIKARLFRDEEELVAEETQAASESDYRDAYHSSLWNILWDKLESWFFSGVISFREMAIYKMSITNDYTIAEMVEHSGYKRTKVTTALKKVKDLVSQVTWNLSCLEAEEAEDALDPYDLNQYN